MMHIYRVFFGADGMHGFGIGRIDWVEETITVGNHWYMLGTWP